MADFAFYRLWKSKLSANYNSKTVDDFIVASLTAPWRPDWTKQQIHEEMTLIRQKLLNTQVYGSEVEQQIFRRTMQLSFAIGRVGQIMSYDLTPKENQAFFDSQTLPIIGQNGVDEMNRKIKSQSIVQLAKAGITPMDE